jgi:prephenate dehydrogenase
MSARPGLGVVGFGAFGRFLAQHLREEFAVVVTDVRDLAVDAGALGVRWGGLAEVAAQPNLVFAVPVQDLEAAALAARSFLRPRARVFEVASVKVKPLELLDQLLPHDVALLGLHPMFGPQSGRQGIAGLKVVLCRPPAPRRATETPRRSTATLRRSAAPRAVRRLLERRLGLQVFEMSPERHDHQMAYIQGLTHWFARALREIELPSPELATVAYQHMLAIEENLRHDSEALFLTIERENPFGKVARADLRRRLEELERWIEGRGQSERGE